MGCTYKYHSELKKLRKIKESVEHFFNLYKIETKTRKRKYVNARSAYAFYSEKYTDASLEYIMKQVGQNHDVYYNCMKVIESNLMSDKLFKKIFNSLEFYLDNHFIKTGNIEVTEVNLIKNKIKLGYDN